MQSLLLNQMRLCNRRLEFNLQIWLHPNHKLKFELLTPAPRVRSYRPMPIRSGSLVRPVTDLAWGINLSRKSVILAFH